MNTTAPRCRSYSDSYGQREQCTKPQGHVTDHLYASEVPEGRCLQHPAYEADYCPLCGTARVIGA